MFRNAFAHKFEPKVSTGNSCCRQFKPRRLIINYFFGLYISEMLKVSRCFKLGEHSDGKKKQTALKLVLDFESPSKFWGFLCGTSLYYLPTSCRTVLVMQASNKIKCLRLSSQSLSGGSPADQKARGLWVRDWEPPNHKIPLQK